MSRRPDSVSWSKFWWQDYDRDPALRRCSLEAQGFWMRVLCIMAEAEPYGRLLVGGTMPSNRELARLVGCGVTERAAAKMMAELGAHRVYSLDEAGVPFCRRMVREHLVRAEARVNGAKGGNPALRKLEPNSSENPQENSQNAEGGAMRDSGDFNGLGDFGVNPPGNHPDKLQEARGEKQDSGSLRSPAAAAAAESGLLPPEQSASAAAGQSAGSDLFGTPPPAPKPAPTPASTLFAEGIPKLIAMTGKSDDAARRFIGKLRKLKADDLTILGAIQEAHRLWLEDRAQVAEPGGFIAGRVTARAKARASAPPESVPAEVNGWIVAEIVARCGELLWADCDAVWAGFSAMIVEMLELRADPEKHIFPVMTSAARKGVRSIDSVGWFRFAISGRLHGTHAA